MPRPQRICIDGKLRCRGYKRDAHFEPKSNFYKKSSDPNDEKFNKYESLCKECVSVKNKEKREQEAKRRAAAPAEDEGGLRYTTLEKISIDVPRSIMTAKWV